MEAMDSTHPHATVTDPDAAAYLSDPLKAVYIYPFIGVARSAGEVAQRYGVRLNALMYRIGCLQRLGLLQQVGERTRQGKPVRLYRATADAFFVPLASTQLENLEAMVDRWSQSLQPVYLRNFARTLHAHGRGWGVRISREFDGRLMIAPAQGPEAFFDYLQDDAPAIVEGWFADLRLDDTDAKAFQHELLALYIKYYGREGRRRYLMRVGMTPLASEEELPVAW